GRRGLAVRPLAARPLIARPLVARPFVARPLANHPLTAHMGRGEMAREIDAARQTLNVSQSGPDRSVEILQLHVGGDETVAEIETDSRADKCAINVDDMG